MWWAARCCWSNAGMGSAAGENAVILEENLANRRKPRMYASFKFGSDEHPYLLDFASGFTVTLTALLPRSTRTRCSNT